VSAEPNVTPSAQASLTRAKQRRLRARLFAILHAPDASNRLARWANWFLAFLIIANAAAVTLESLSGLDPVFARWLWRFEAVSTALFIIEYVARVWTCVEQRHLSHPLWGRLRYMGQPLALLDLVAIVTWWTPWDLRFLRVVRLVRLLKIMHLYEFEAALERLGMSLQKRKELLLVSVALMAIFVYLASSLLYQIEHARQPAVFSSVPATAPTAIVIAAIIESSASGSAYVCEECGHHGFTTHRHGRPQAAAAPPGAAPEA